MVRGAEPTSPLRVSITNPSRFERVPFHRRRMFELIDENEDSTGCTWTIQALDSEGGLQRTRVRLGWADYGVWSPDGGIPPERVAEAVVAFAMGHPAFGPLPELLDAAMARRRIPDADAEIGRLIR
jgi:hypothetical protein